MMDGFARRILPLAAVLLVLTSVTQLAAQQEPPTGIRIARLVEDLGARQYLHREQATAALKQAGNDARGQLEAAAKSDNPEVRRRAINLLHDMHLDDLWRAGTVRLPVATGDASEMVLAIAEQTGNRIYLGDSYGSFNDGPVELPLAGELWPLLDSICRQSGNRVRPHYGVNRDGLVLVGGTPGEYPVAYSGPLRAQITSAKREFSEELEYDAHSSKIDHKFQFNVQVTWEDRFRLAAARATVELIEAKTATGQIVRSAQSSPSNWHVFDESSRQFAAAVKLEPPGADVKSLDKLVLEWDLIAIGRFAQLPIDELEINERHRVDDVIAMVHRIEHLNGSRWEVELSVARDLPIPEPEEILYRENAFELLDQQGHLMRPNGQSHLTVEAGVARYKLTFRGESEASRPAKLILHYPQLRDRRRIRFEFSDVPLPIAQPK